MKKELNLLTLARSGDNTAKNKIIQKYENIVVTNAKKYSNIYYTFDELKQEGRLGVLKAIEKYDIKRKVHFVNFANLCVKTRILSLLRKLNKREVLFSTITDDFQCEAENADIEEKMLDKDLKKNFLKFKNTRLTEEENQILKYFTNGASYKEIAVRLNISEKKVDNSLYKIKNKLKDFILR